MEKSLFSFIYLIHNEKRFFPFSLFPFFLPLTLYTSLRSAMAVSSKLNYYFSVYIALASARIISDNPAPREVL